MKAQVKLKRMGGMGHCLNLESKEKWKDDTKVLSRCNWENGNATNKN